jgi:hypothetical protein
VSGGKVMGWLVFGGDDVEMQSDVKAQHGECGRK